jgi:hypothetical protein
MTPKFAPIVRDARLRIETPRIAIIAVIFHQPGKIEYEDSYLESPFWNEGFRVG